MQHRALSIAAAMTVVVMLSAPVAVAQLPVPPVGGPPNDGPGAGAPIKAFSVVPFLDLLEITAAELLGGAGAARDAGTAQPLVGIGLVADLGDPIGGSAPETGVRREAHLWEAWVHKNDLDSLQVDVELTSEDGTPDELSSVDSAASRILVDTWPLPYEIVDQDGAWNLIRGGVRMDLDLAQATVAGSYRGLLLVVLNNL